MFCLTCSTSSEDMSHTGSVYEGFKSLSIEELKNKSDNDANNDNVVKRYVSIHRMKPIVSVLHQYNKTDDVIRKIEKLEKTEDVWKAYQGMLNLLNAPVNEAGSSLLHLAVHPIYRPPGQKEPILTQEMLQVVIAAGANLDARNTLEEATALHVAAGMGYKYSVTVLLAHGADNKAKDKHERTPEDLAQKNKQNEILQIFESNKSSKEKK